MKTRMFATAYSEIPFQTCPGNKALSRSTTGLHAMLGQVRAKNSTLLPICVAGMNMAEGATFTMAVISLFTLALAALIEDNP